MGSEGETDAPYTRALLEFVEALRARGVTVSPDEVTTAARALTVVDPLDRDQFYHALRTTLVDDPDELSAFEAVFAAFWTAPGAEESLDADAPGSGPGPSTAEGGDTGAASVEVGSDDPLDLDAPSGEGDGESDAADRRPRGAGAEDRHLEGEMAMAIGREEATSDVDVSIVEDEHELAELSLLVTELGRQLGALRGLRQRRHPSGDIDLRRSLEVAREQNPADLPRVDAERSQAKVRFFVDVSQSMLQNMDQAFLLLFLFECVRQFADVRVFMFDTRATEVTRHFRTADVARTVTEMRRAQTEWGAGTTIGACLDDVLGADPFVVDRDTVAVVVSDGWDAGDVDVLTDQMRQLQRRCRSVVWFDPRATVEEFEPEVGGLQAAMPYVDHFLAFSSLDDLRTAVEHLRSSAEVR